jgi:hypothetical protein
MEDESDAIPPIHIDDLIAQIMLSKQQVERGEVVSAAEVLAEMRARFEARFPSHVRRERKAGHFSGCCPL